MNYDKSKFFIKVFICGKILLIRSIKRKLFKLNDKNKFMGDHYKLRPHHLLNLVIGSTDNYSNLEEGLKKTRLKLTFGEIRPYTDEDALISRRFYHEISSNPENEIQIVDGIDDRCKICSNYSIGCTVFSEKNLKLEDDRSLKNFPGLNIEDNIKVSELFSTYKN